MGGPLLHIFFFLMASRGGSGQLLGQLCYVPLKGPGSHMVAYYCPGFQDHANSRFCCGTCRKPFCCSSRLNSFDPTRCPAFHPTPAVTSPTKASFGADGRLNILWSFVGILIGTVILWSLCRNYRVFKCSRVCGDHEEEAEGEEEVAMEERRCPAPPPPVLPPPPSPPGNFDYPPPYSAIDPLASLQVSVTNASLTMFPTEDGVEGGVPAGLRGAEGESPPGLRGAEGGVQLRGAEGESPPGLRGAEGGSPPGLSGAEGGARSRLRGAEGGIPPGFREAEWGDPSPPYPDDPPPYSDIHLFASPIFLPPAASAPRRKRRAKAPRSVRWAPAEPAGTGRGAAAEAFGAAGGGVPGEPAGAVGGAPDEPSGAAEGGVPGEPAGAEGGAFAM